MQVNKFLETFKLLISELYDQNVVIGGVSALLIHGLEFNRPASDLDLIIFTPNRKQKDALRILKSFDVIKDRPGDIYDEEGLVKAYKFKRQDIYLDVILSDLTVPENLLIYRFNGIEYKVNRINHIIEAKKSYFFDKKQNNDLIKYVRGKDALDMIALKNMNFNL